MDRDLSYTVRLNTRVGTGVAETSGSTTQWGPRNAATTAARNVRRILVRGVNARLPPEAKKI